MQDDYFETNRKDQINIWVAKQMLRGAGYAAAVVVGAGLIIAAIWGIGLLLPEESKQSPDPNTWSALAQPLLVRLA
ncbi:MAG: RC-LH1 core complex protein PufX [Tabrizicola sp.]|nr:RC-LH1 core complex protein PufX [Tabrizicola sp.]